MEKITFGYGVKRIDNRAFCERSNLKDVVFYSGIEEIGQRAFYKTGLTSVVIPSTVKLMDIYAFAYCGALTALTVGDDVGKSAVMQINNYAFSYCSNLATVTFNSGVNRIGKDVFIKSSNIKDVYINDLLSYLAINFGEMEYCQESNPVQYAENVYVNGDIVKNLVIPEGVTNICNYAFAHCGSLETVKLPSTLKEIGEHAFASCINLKNLDLPESVESIGDSAFMGCIKLSTLEFKKNIKYIGLSAFDYCTGLETIYMYPQVLDIGQAAFLTVEI